MSILPETDPMILSLLASFALADSITLDTGATIEGDLARYEFGGDCQISVTEGGLLGTIVIVPCHRVVTFQRTSARTPVPIGLETEAAKVATVREEPLAPTGAVSAPAVEARPAHDAAYVSTGSTTHGQAQQPAARAVSFGQSAGAVEAPLHPEDLAATTVPTEEVGSRSLVAGPLAEPDGPVETGADAPFYDEPLFPVDATTPIAPAVADTAAPAASAPTSASRAAPAATPAPHAVVPAPSAMETTGPRLAPRMDEAPPTSAAPSPSRSVSF